MIDRILTRSAKRVCLAIVNYSSGGDDLDTGHVLGRVLVSALDLIELDTEGHVVVLVDRKMSARTYTDPQVKASLQLSVYKYATAFEVGSGPPFTMAV